MKKSSLMLAAVIFLLISPTVQAAKNNNATQDTGKQISPTQAQPRPTVSPTGYQVQNQNQVETQNQGEADQLQINTQEQESLTANQASSAADKTSSSSAKARENMNAATKQVETLLTNPSNQSGVGEQIKQIAQSQQQAQSQIQGELSKINQRSEVMKFIIGPDYQTLKNLQKQVEQNQLRIQQLEQLKTQLTNQSDITMVQATIEALTAQNTTLQTQIAAEEKTGSLLGWLLKWFIK